MIFQISPALVKQIKEVKTDTSSFRIMEIVDGANGGDFSLSLPDDFDAKKVPLLEKIKIIADVIPYKSGFKQGFKLTDIKIEKFAS
jgi:hypothetical protein